MDDAVLESAHYTFDRILLGLFSASLIGGLIAWIQAGFASPWVLVAEKLVLLVLIVLILHWLNRFTLAVYLLILGLMGLVIELLLQANGFTQFAPYLFIPIIIVASLIVSAPVTLTFAFFSIIALVVTTTITRPMSLTALIEVLPPGALLLLTAFLATLNRRQLAKLNHRYAENKTLLQQRTLETAKLQEEVQSLQVKLVDLEKLLAETKAEAGQTRRQTVQKDHQLYALIKGTVQDSKAAVKRLEDVIGGIATASNGSRSQFFNQAWQGLDHLSSLVTSLEEIIGLEHEELKLEYQVTDMGQLLAELVDAMRSLAREKKLQLRYTPPANPLLLSADPVRLRQALLQILGNALKYTEQGVIEVQTELTERELVIFISDTGVGMSAEALVALFQPSAPAQPKPVQAHRGPGLGLKLAKRLIELHRGRIWANSIKGVGSTFCVALPLRSPEEMLEATRVSPARLPKRSAITAPAKIMPAAVAKTPVQASRVSAPPPQKENPPQAKAARETHLGPVARFSPLYIGRFGLILMSLLLTVLGAVICLALVNGPVLPPATPTVLVHLPVSPSPTQTSATELTAVAQQPAPSPTPAATKVATFAANLPSQAGREQLTPTPSPTTLPATEKAQATPVSTPTPAATATPLPTATSTATPLPAATSTATSVPTATSTATPLPAATSTATSLPTATSTTTPLPTIIPTSTVSPATPTPTPINIALAADQAAGLGLTLLKSEAGPLLAQTQGEANGRASWSSAGILLAQTVGGERDLYLLQPGQSQPLNLTAGPGDDLQPAWSPDGQKIAFSSGRSGNLDIYVMSQNVGAALPLTTSRGYDEWPVWSPDGQRIAFVSDRDGNVEIYVMNSDGSNQQRLTDNPADDWPAAWSPDGRRLVFASNRDGNWNLYVLDSTGDNISRLTNDPGDEREPVWSPDGRIITFAANSNGNWDIYSLPAPGSAPAETPLSAWTQLTTTPTDERYPAWLP